MQKIFCTFERDYLRPKVTVRTDFLSFHIFIDKFTDFALFAFFAIFAKNLPSDVTFCFP